MRVQAGALLVVLLLATLAAGAQESEAGAPLSEAELVHLVNAKTPVEQIIAEVKARGISFRPSAELQDGLKKLKLEALVAALTLPATLELQVNAPGAEVTVDGEKRSSVSPQGLATLTELVPGRHVLRVRAEGRVDETKDVFLKPGETRRVEIELLAAVSTSPGPLGIRVNIQAGTAVDAALQQLEFNMPTEERLGLIQKFLERFGDSPAVVLGYAALQDTYLRDNQYDKSIAAGEELLRRDPRNFEARLRLAHAYTEKGDLEAAFNQAGEAGKLVEELRAATPPAGTSEDAWEREKAALLESAQREWGSLAYGIFVPTGQVADPARRRPLLERFVEIFARTDYRPQAVVSLALTCRQLGDLEATLRWGDQGLEADPNEHTLLWLVADVLSERSVGSQGPSAKDLGRARELATRLLDRLTNAADQVRQPGLTDEQWAAQKAVLEGLAHTIRGQVLMYEETSAAMAGMAKTRQAIEEFRAAVPLLKAEPFYYARNLYRLGFAYAKVGQLAPAREVLSELVGLVSPYQQPARDLLARVQRKLGPR